jgi:triosephosphate isomerase
MTSEVITFEEINEIVKGLIRARLGKQLILLSCVARMEREREREKTRSIIEIRILLAARSLLSFFIRVASCG